MSYSLHYTTAELDRYKIHLVKTDFGNTDEALKHFHKNIDCAQIVKAWITKHESNDSKVLDIKG